MNRGYIFVGENIPAVYQSVLDFAKGLNCKENAHADFQNSVADVSFCGICVSCAAFDNQNHPDTFYVVGTKKSIGVDDIRDQLIQPMSLKPYSHKYKVFIVERAQDLTPAAQNVLLKTIEEPAEYGVFLFVSPNTRAFLPTVLSRCDILRFSDEAHAEYSQELIALSGEIHEKLNMSDIYDSFLLHGKLEKLERSDVLKILDLLFAKYGSKAAQGSKFVSACKEIIKTKQILSGNGNLQLAIELLFVKLRGTTG